MIDANDPRHRRRARRARRALRKPIRAGSRGGVPILKARDPDVRITLETLDTLRDEAPVTFQLDLNLLRR
jgi:hypothetical protein